MFCFIADDAKRREPDSGAAEQGVSCGKPWRAWTLSNDMFSGMEEVQQVLKVLESRRKCDLAG